MLKKKVYNLEHKKLNQYFKNIDYNKIPKSNEQPNKTTMDAINGPFYRIR